jgi:hypothetical protein
MKASPYLYRSTDKYFEHRIPLLTLSIRSVSHSLVYKMGQHRNMANIHILDRQSSSYQQLQSVIGGMANSTKCRLNHNLAVLKHKIAGKVMLPTDLSVWLIKWTDSVLL